MLGPSIELEIPHEIRVEDLRHILQSNYPQATTQLAQALVAVNRTYATEHEPVTASDEIALIPPVGGGSPDEEATVQSCRVTQDALHIDEAYQVLSNSRHGAVVAFCGTVREWTGQRQTVRLEYEAYETMALEQMKRIEDSVRERWPDTVTLQWHRVGTLYPEDIAVVCAAASPHRDDAFGAARELIERLKQEVPIWKKEYFRDETSVWKSNTP